MATKKVKDYDESSIKHLSGKEAVRAKPQMYIGPTDERGVFTILREALDNIIDEAISGNCSTGEVFISDEGRYYVIDNGRGIPVGDMQVKDNVTGKPHTLPAIQAITSLLHTGGKMETSGDAAYSASRGCFAGETKVRLLNGKIKTMKWLYYRWLKDQTPIPIMTFDLKAQSIVPSFISHVQLTKHTKDLVEVKVDSGETVRVTPDHPFYVNRDGRIKRVEAGKLKNGDSLVSTYYSEDKNGYLLQTEQGSKFKVHRRVAEFYADQPLRSGIDEVHHRSRNVKNNEPTNLEVLTKSDHQREHSTERSNHSFLKIMVDQADLREKNSLAFSAQNADEVFKVTSWSTKAVKIAARAIFRFGSLTPDTFNSARIGADMRYDTAIGYVDEVNLELQAVALLHKLKSDVGVKSVSERILAALETGFESRLSPTELSTHANWVKTVDGWKTFLLSLPSPEDATPKEFNKTSGAVVFGRYANLSKFTSLKALKDHVLDGQPLRLFEDLSETAQDARKYAAEIQMREEKSLRKMVSYFVGSCRHALHEAGYINESSYSACKATCAPKFGFGLAIVEHFGGDISDLQSFVESYNHKVESVTVLSLKKAEPVFDITVDNEHTFFIEPGILVKNTHGVGIKATNFLSTEFRVRTFNKGKWWLIGFKQGALTTNLKECTAPTHPLSGEKLKKGTVVDFLPDETIFSKLKFPTAMLQEWASLASYFTPNFRFTISHHSGKSKEYFAENGPLQYVSDAMTKLEAQPITDSVFSFTNPLVDCVFQYSTLDGNSMRGFTNGLSNAEGGVHLDAFFTALKSAIQPFAKKNQVFTVNELREGLIGLINVKLSAPQFDSQTKEKLVDARGKEPVQNYLNDALAQFFKENKKFALELCDRCSQLKQLKNRFQQSRRALTEIRRITSKGLPSKAATAPGCAPEDRELILLEGESASGCFTGDTKVRLINGESMRFDDMAELAKQGEEFYGYAYDIRNERTTVIKFDEPRLTKHVVELVEVTLSNGQVLRCTTDHPFLTREGVYVAAEKLKVGTDLMTHAEEIEEVKQGSPRRVAVSPTITLEGGGQRIYGSKVYVFRSAAFLLRRNRKALRNSVAEDPVQVHHLDGNSLNDHPTNLEALPESAHRTLHASEGGKLSMVGERHSRRMKEEPEYRKKFIAGTKVRMKEIWSDNGRRSLQSVTIKKYFESPEARAKTSASTSVGLKKLWLRIALHAADPFSDDGFELAKRLVGSRTPMRSKTWSKFFYSKSQAIAALKKAAKDSK